MEMAISSATFELAKLAAEGATRRDQEIRRSRAAAQRQWYVAHNGMGTDKHAQNTLKHAGFDFYYPMTEEFRVVPKRALSASQRLSSVPIKRLTPVPLFPRYLFVYFDLSSSGWREAFELACIHGILFADDGAKPLPAPVGEHEILKLKAKEDARGIIPGTVPVKALYEIGEKVRISAGPFSGHNGTVACPPNCTAADLDESAKVGLLVSLLGCACPVELPISDIEKL